MSDVLPYSEQQEREARRAASRARLDALFPSHPRDIEGLRQCAIDVVNGWGVREITANDAVGALLKIVSDLAKLARALEAHRYENH